MKKIFNPFTLKNNIKSILNKSSLTLKLTTLSVIPFTFYLNYKKNSYLYSQEKEKLDKKSLSPQDIVKGEYENRIRVFSPIEKRYQIFGKIKTHLDQMSIIDFFDSLLFFQGNNRYKKKVTNEFLDKQTEYCNLLSKVDVNDDKQISIDEYFILCYLISRK